MRLQLEQHRLDRLPEIIAQMMKPAEKIDSIRIHQVTGFGGSSNAGRQRRRRRRRRAARAGHAGDGQHPRHGAAASGPEEHRRFDRRGSFRGGRSRRAAATRRRASSLIPQATSRGRRADAVLAAFVAIRRINNRSRLMSFSRRQFIASTSGAAAGIALPFHVFAQGAPIKLGSVLDNSGNLDVYGKPMVMATTLAVEEINAAGGLLGRKIQVDPVRHPVRHRALHQVRAAARARRQGRRRPRRHHLGVARGDPADLPARQHPLLLQRALRGRRLRPQLLRHRHDAGAGGRADRRDLAEAVGQEGLRARRRLQLRPDHRQVGRALRQAARRLGAADRLLPARRRRLRLDDRQDPGGQARLRCAPRWSAARTSRSSASGRRRA